jgi:choline dehydrogenase-like flavoprotein
MRAGQEAGHKVNLDNNDGDEEGISIAQFNVNNGTRVTSSTAYLETSVKDMKNLIVVTNALASKLLIENKQVKGVEILHANKLGGREKVVAWAMKEVILTAGCFQSPHLLLLSGIGPAEDLGTLEIPLIANIPVGQNLQDHSALACEFIIDPTIAGHNQLLNDPKELKEATERYAQTKDGPLAMFGASAAIIFPKLQQLHRTKEFKELDNATRTFLEAKGRPSTEIWMHSGPLFYTGPCPPDASVLVIEGLCQNNLSRGSLKLASSDPRELPNIDPGYLSHPYDIHIAIETIRSILQLARTPTFSSIIQSVLLGPRSPVDEKTLAADSGEDDTVIEVFVRETLTQGFHSMSTCTMGKDENKNKVVDKQFKVVGVERLRVADMSVCPILTCNHTQVNAYLIGQRCAELIVGEWGGVKRRGTKL